MIVSAALILESIGVTSGLAKVLFIQPIRDSQSHARCVFERLVPIYRFRSIKIQPKHEPLGNKPHIPYYSVAGECRGDMLCSYSSEPRTDVYCFRLNFKILVNCVFLRILIGSLRY